MSTEQNLAKRNRLAEQLEAAKQRVYDLERALNEADGVLLRGQKPAEFLHFGHTVWTLTRREA